jgi:hypothetical protein
VKAAEPPRAQTPEELAALYHQAFSTEAGEAVLDDLRKRYHTQHTSLRPDPYATAANEGQRSVVLLIEHMIRQHTQPRTRQQSTTERPQEG